MKLADDLRWDVGSLPFVWTPLRAAHNPEGLPDVLPFSLGVEARTGALVQLANPDVSAALTRVYAMGSMITGQMDETGIGRIYADDFLAFIGRALGLERFDGKRILEIGCGNGYLLSRLRALGADVIGLEPGEHGASRFDVPIVRDLFPSPSVTGTFDVIVMFGVLEHIEDPAAFLAKVEAFRAPGGSIVAAVPDCAPYIDTGDLSCLIHEHWSYFDARSFGRALSRKGAVVDVEASGFGGLAYGHLRDGSAPRDEGDAEDVTARLRAYREGATRSRRVLGDYLGAAKARGESVGIYVPGRVINALFVTGVRVREGEATLRLFDDNPLLLGTFFPGLPVPVEDRAALLAAPTDRVLIMTRSFGVTLAKELRERLGPSVGITLWHDLLLA